MKNFAFIGAVLSCCCWISGSQIVSVQPGEKVTLLCKRHPDAPLFWFRVLNRTRISCISVTAQTGSTNYCDGFKSGSFHTSFNKNTSSLNIKQLNVSDSGLYFCGFAIKGHKHFTATLLHVNGTGASKGETKNEENTPDFNTLLIIFLLYGANGLLFVIIIILIIICLVCKAKKSKKADDSSRNPDQNEDTADLYENCTSNVTRVNTIYDSYGLA